ncbi:type IX secretion system membrane protein PorP/SprF [Inquilinus sp. KBS0705]|nr:type IX secretion system membrane protein PorP/SprF [Inquilinus sp. KBS0705]
MAFIANAQQDAQFSQYVFNGLYVNPAYAGYKQDTYMNAFYRSQWTGLEGAPRTFSLAVDGATAENKVGLGLLVAQDKLGAQSNLAVYGNYAYRLQMGDNENNRLAFGLGAGFIQNGIDGTKLNPLQSGDEYIPTNFQSSILPDARAGVLYTNEHFFAGFSADNLVAHLLAAKRDKSVAVPVPVPHFYLTGGAIYTLNDQVKLRPSFLIKDDRGGPTSLDLNLFMLLNEKIWIGGTYRTAIPLYNKPYLQNNLQKSNAFVGLVEIFATDRLRIGYAFDYSLTPLANYSYGSHELSIGIYLRKSYENTSSNRCYF